MAIQTCLPYQHCSGEGGNTVIIIDISEKFAEIRNFLILVSVVGADEAEL